MPPAPKKTRASSSKSHWTTEEVVLTIFLRSRRVKDRAIIAILKERYPPKIRQLGSIRNKMQAVRASESKSGRINLTNDPFFTRIENVDRWIVGQIHDAHARSELLTFTEHELGVMKRVSRHKN